MCGRRAPGRGLAGRRGPGEPLPAAGGRAVVPGDAARTTGSTACSVLRALLDQGHTDPDLLAAALLHDVGKTQGGAGRLQLWHRVAAVLMRTFAPGLLGRMGQAQTGGWRQPFYVQQQHGAIGAELAAQAGCSARTVALIRCHEDLPADTDDPLLAALQAAICELG